MEEWKIYAQAAAVLISMSILREVNACAVLAACATRTKEYFSNATLTAARLMRTAKFAGALLYQNPTLAARLTRLMCGHWWERARHMIGERILMSGLPNGGVESLQSPKETSSASETLTEHPHSTAAQ